MSRWEPNTLERLQEAAIALFHEYGYSKVTIADITERAGVTKRSFFNHFPDKREVLFAGAPALEESVRQYVADAERERAPIDVAVSALIQAGEDLPRYGSFARLRNEVIASSPELQERNLIKIAALGTGIAATLQSRQVGARTAELVSRAAITVFTIAYNEWTEDQTLDFGASMRAILAELTSVIDNDGNEAATKGGSLQPLQ
jgi:AcrR family transcriptional regulator